MIRALSLCLLAIGLSVGCGGADRGRPERSSGDATTAIDACADVSARLEAGLELQAIVDFEPTDGTEPSKLRPECEPETPCGFYFNYDTALSPADPPTPSCNLGDGIVAELNQMAGPPFAYPIPEPRCGESKYGYHQLGKNIAVCTNPKTGRQGWGASLQVTLNADPNDSGRALEPVDASSWDGVAFWVRLGNEPSNQGLLIAATDPYTTRQPASAIGESDYCSTADGIPDAKKCDAFTMAVLLEPEWRFVTVPFALMQQKGYGVPSELGMLDASQLLGLSLQFSAGNWDVWIDDVSLYRETR